MEQICKDIVNNIFQESAQSVVFQHLAFEVAGYEMMNIRTDLMVIHPGDMRIILALMLAHDECIVISPTIISAINAIDDLYPGGAPVDDEHPRKISGLRVAKNVGGGDQAVVVLEDNANEPVEKTDIPLLTNAEELSADMPDLNIQCRKLRDELTQFRREQGRVNDRIISLVVWMPIVSVAAYALGELIGSMIH